MNGETSKNDGAGGNAPAFSGDGGALVCIDAAEARLMRRHGHKCITSPKLRDLIIRILESGATLHCVFEGLVVEDEEGVRRAEELLRMSTALDVAATRIDPTLLPPIDEVDSFS